MRSARSHFYVFFAAFGTFAAAFAVLAAVVKPQLEKRRAEQLAAGTHQHALVDRAGQAPAGASAPLAAAGVSRRATGKIVDARANPIAGAIVELRDSGGDSSVTTTTDDEGRFTFESILVTVPSIHVSAPGYQAATSYEATRRGSQLTFEALTLRDGGALRLRVSGDAEGAITGATVQLLTKSGSVAATSAPTGADGTTVLRGVDVGHYQLRVTAPGHAIAERDWQFGGVGRDGTNEFAFVLLPLVAELVGEVADEQHVPVDGGIVRARLVRPEPPADQEWTAEIASDGSFRLGPLPQGTFELTLDAPGLVQQGHVFGDSGSEPIEISASHGGGVGGNLVAEAPLSSAPTLTLWRIESDGHATPVAGVASARIDLEAGRFRIDGVSPGRYFIRASAAGYAPARTAPFVVAIDAAPDDLHLEFGDGGELHGTLIDHRGGAVSGARVTVYEGASPPPPAWAERFPADARRSGATAEDGRFAIADLAAGSHVVVIEAPGQPQRTFGPLWVEPGSRVELPQLALGGGAVLTMSLRDGEARPAAGGRVHVTCAQPVVDLHAIADQDGNICLRGLPDGDYWLTPGDGSEPQAATLVAGDTHRFELHHSIR